MGDVLEGVRVLEVATWTFVPAAGAVLADWGAEVIKVEPPNGGDPQRGLSTMGILPGGAGINFMIEFPNRGKRSVALDVRVIEPADLPGAVTGDPLVLPDEQVTRALAARHDLGRGRELIFDRTFLRWDRDWSLAQRPARFDGAVASGDLPRGLIARARDLAGHSSDWWRQVGAIAVRGDELLGSAWNQHYPTEYAPYADGDPRDHRDQQRREPPDLFPSQPAHNRHRQQRHNRQCD